MAGNNFDIYRGSKEIGAAVGVNWKEMAYYVREKGLPAFKIDGKGGWIAIHDDLSKWVTRMRDENLHQNVKNIEE